MLLGVSTSFEHTSPKDWADKMLEIGGKAVVFPVNYLADEEVIQGYADAAKEAGLTIAEVGVWKNTLSADPKERAQAQEYAIGQLKLADRIGANCCVNICGTDAGPKWDGGYRGNYRKETWDEIVRMIQYIIDEANPQHTKYSIEPMPWMVPSGPDEYLKLIKDVNRPQFGVHMDLINMINCPERYFFMDEFMEECFTKLKGHICSCHLKDIILREEFTFQLRETFCGDGAFNIELYTKLATAENPNMPMLIEHLHTDEEYRNSMCYVQNRLGIK